MPQPSQHQASDCSIRVASEEGAGRVNAFEPDEPQTFAERSYVFVRKEVLAVCVGIVSALFITDGCKGLLREGLPNLPVLQDLLLLCGGILLFVVLAVVSAICPRDRTVFDWFRSIQAEESRYAPDPPRRKKRPEKTGRVAGMNGAAEVPTSRPRRLDASHHA